MPQAPAPTVPELKQPSADPETLWKSWRAAPVTPQGNAEMLTAVHPIIERAARTHVGQVNPIIMGRARRMALEGLRSYNPERGRLQSHLFNQLQGLKRYAAQAAQGVKMPERVALDRRHLDLTAQQLIDDLGRDPTDDELAEKSGLSTRRIGKVRGFNPSMSTGFFSQMGEDGSGYDPAVTQSGDGPAVDPWIAAVADGLSPRDVKILEWTIGLNGNEVLPSGEIAKRLRLSPGMVSERKRMIQQQLDQEAELSPF